MRILITGGSGFLGQALIGPLQSDGHEIIILSRHPDRHRRKGNPAVRWAGSLEEITGPVDAVINLAGANLFTLPWTNRRKQELWDSRIATTERLVQWMERQEKKPTMFLSGSAVGIYGDQGETLLTEVSEPGHDWPTKLVLAWENTAAGAERMGIRTVYLRTGLVLGNGGLLKPLLPVFKAGLGGSLGDGQFWYSWIHWYDWVQAVRYLLTTPTLQGPVNLTAPNPVRYQAFARTLGKTLRRPVWLTPPRWALRPVLGERTDLMLASTRAIPQQLSDAGFSWQYPELEAALRDLTGTRQQ